MDDGPDYGVIKAKTNLNQFWCRFDQHIHLLTFQNQKFYKHFHLQVKHFLLPSLDEQPKKFEILIISKCARSRKLKV